MAPVPGGDGTGGEPVKAPWPCWLDVGTLQQRLPGAELEAAEVTVEVDIAPGCRGFQVVGLADTPGRNAGAVRARLAQQAASRVLP